MSPLSILFGYSSDRGLTWRRSVLPWGFTDPLYVRDIAFDRKGNIWLLWTSTGGEIGPYYINLAKSADSGRTFTTLFTAREYFVPTFESKLAVDDFNNVFILWYDRQLKLTRFKDGDSNRRHDIEIPNDSLGIGPSMSLSVGAQGKVYCLWMGGAGRRTSVFCSVSMDTGTTLNGKVRVDTSEVFVPAGFSFQGYPQCAVDSEGVLYVVYVRETARYDSSQIQLAASVDDGRSFTQRGMVPQLLSNNSPSICIDAVKGVNVLWRAMGGTYHCLSRNGGSTFTEPRRIGSGKADINADRFGNLYTTLETTLETGRVFFSRTYVATSAREDAVQPLRSELHQIYPNPFNASTRISFTVVEPSQVVVRILDVLGREVATPVDGWFERGSYVSTWYAGNSSTGIYFARMETGKGPIAVQKVALVR